MLGVRKKFNQKEHDQYDVMGRDAILYFLNKIKDDNSCKIINNPDKYGIDVLTIKDDAVIRAWEIEVRGGNWKGDIMFPFSEINCIERKDYLWKKDERFLKHIPFKVADDCKVFYVQLNDLCTRAVFIPGEVVLQYNLKPWSNRKASGEYVRQVPINRTIQLKISEKSS